MTQFTIKSTLSLILGHSSMQRDDFNMSTGSPPPPFFFSLKMRFVSHLLRLFLPGELELSQFQNIICIRLSHLHGFQRKYWNVPKETQITVFFTMDNFCPLCAQICSWTLQLCRNILHKNCTVYSRIQNQAEIHRAKCKTIKILQLKV